MFLSSDEENSDSFRVLISEDDYYNWDFSSPAEFVCYRLSHPLDDGECFGYARRGSAAHQMLKQLIKKNTELGYRNSKAILSLRSDQIGSKPKQVMIDAVDSEEWLTWSS